MVFLRYGYFNSIVQTAQPLTKYNSGQNNCPPRVNNLQIITVSHRICIYIELILVQKVSPASGQ